MRTIPLLSACNLLLLVSFAARAAETDPKPVQKPERIDVQLQGAPTRYMWTWSVTVSASRHR